MKLYPAAKKEIMTFERKQVELEIIMFNKGWQTQRSNYHKKCRERETAECWALNGTAVSHPNLLKLRGHCERRGRKTVGARGSEDCCKTCSQTRQGLTHKDSHKTCTRSSLQNSSMDREQGQWKALLPDVPPWLLQAMDWNFKLCAKISPRPSMLLFIRVFYHKN